jgi:GMP synthase-like glutamine amidotransferase
MAGQTFLVPRTEQELASVGQAFLIVLGSGLAVAVVAVALSFYLGEIPILGRLALRPPDSDDRSAGDRPVPALGEVFDLNPNTMTEPPGLLVLMGGPMSVNDTAEHAWIEPETQRVREAIDAGAAVLGVCLGAQLIARALGAAVYPMNHREIGWHPVEAVNNHQAFGLPRRFTPLHWHGETFDLPDGATRLAGNEACTNQAFAVGRRVVGLQFHLETTPATAAALVEHCGHEISPGPDQQTPQQIADCDAQAAAVHPILFALLDRITATP